MYAKLAALALAIVAVPLAAQDYLLNAQGDPLTVAAVSDGLLLSGHDFDYAPLNDDSPRWLSENGSAAVEILGRETAVREISIMSGLTGTDTVTLIMALAIGAPWAMDWMPDATGDTLARAKRASSGIADATITRDGIEVEVSVFLPSRLIFLRIYRLI